ncbi:MAG: hypothetical protein KA313_04625 [Pseudarcicella sp.]|nr:hypothetical protein [Pseudarcicella sp.]
MSYLAHPDVKSFKNLVYVFNDAKLKQGEDSPRNMIKQLYIKYAKEIF